MDANEFEKLAKPSRGYNKELIKELFDYKETKKLNFLSNTNSGYNICAYIDENKKLVDIFDAAKYTDSDLKSLWIDAFYNNSETMDTIVIRNQIIWHYFIKKKNDIIISLFKLLDENNNSTFNTTVKGESCKLIDISSYLPFERGVYYVEYDKEGELEDQWLTDIVARYNSPISYVFDQLALEIIYSLEENKYYYGSTKRIAKSYIGGLIYWNSSRDADIYLNRKVFKETTKRFPKIMDLASDNSYQINDYTVEDCVSLDTGLQEMIIFSYSMGLSFFTKALKEYNDDVSQVESAIARLYNNFFSRHKCRDWRKRSGMETIKYILDEKHIIGDTFLSELNDDLKSSYLEVSLNY